MTFSPTEVTCGNKHSTITLVLTISEPFTLLPVGTDLRTMEADLSEANKPAETNTIF